MDHITPPLGIRHSEESQVLYIASWDYLNVPFLQYAAKQKNYRITEDLHDAAMMSLQESQMKMSELEKLLQTWLFFGLLQETLGERFNERDFLQTVESGLVLSTKVLPQKLNAAIYHYDYERCLHIQECLYWASLALTSTPALFNSRLKICLALTAELISTTLIIAVKDKRLNIELRSTLWSWGTYDDHDERVKQMRNGNWCPAQARSLLGKFYSLQGKIYISQIVKPQSNNNHDACVGASCQALQINPSVYKTRHRCQEGCANLKIDQTQLIKVLKRNQNALLDLTLDASGAIGIRVVPSQSGSWYVALSHVWSEGLGNVEENSLPGCQLRYLYDLLTHLPRKTQNTSYIWYIYELLMTPFKRSQKRPYLWVDTLCCPVDPGGKVLALAKIAEVYRNATQVLVLDSSLSQVDSKGMEPIEIMSRVFCSGWIFRLWTLKEANLASKLCIQFRDQTLDFGQVRNMLPEMIDPETYNFIGELISEYDRLKIISLEAVHNQLWHLTGALRYRSVSEISDEPICLAALLRLDVEKISYGESLQISTREDSIRLRDIMTMRLWEQFIQSQPFIPNTIIYHVGDRLSKPGLRWAPSTLLNINNISLFIDSENPALPSLEGLFCKSAAFSVSIPGRVDGILSKPSAVASTLFDILKCDDGAWYTLFSTIEQKRYPVGSEDMAYYDIIASQNCQFEILFQHSSKISQVSDQGINCVLVSNKVEEEVKKVHFIRQAYLISHDDVTKKVLDAVLSQAQELQRDVITQEMLNTGKNGEQTPEYTTAFKKMQVMAEAAVDDLESEIDGTSMQLSDAGLGLVHNRRKAIFALLSRFYRNRYLQKGKEFPITQEYCID